MDFEPFPKMARLSRQCIITEKLDGSNAQIAISDDGTEIKAGSRTRWITPGKSTDNFGFARWVQDNKEELLKLGPGRHFGEWWGQGIQRGYDMKERKFSLFNVSRWSDNRPTCCDVVPTLWVGEFDTVEVDNTLHVLHVDGSKASPGFMKPEGIIVYHIAAGVGFKKTFDDNHKG